MIASGSTADSGSGRVQTTARSPAPLIAIWRPFGITPVGISVTVVAPPKAVPPGGFVAASIR